MSASATDALEVVRAQVSDANARRGDEVLVETELRYADDTPVSVHIRKRGRRYDIDDEGPPSGRRLPSVSRPGRRLRETS